MVAYLRKKDVKDVLPAVTTNPRDGSRFFLNPPCEYGRSVATVDRVAVVTIVESLITVFAPSQHSSNGLEVR